MLLEYSIVSSEYTSIANKAQALNEKIGVARQKQDDLRSQRTRSERKTAKATKMVSVSQTCEFVETRAAKVSGQRAPFEGRIMTDQ